MLFVKGATIMTMAGDDIVNGVLQADPTTGKIIAVGAAGDLPVPDAGDGIEIIDATGKFIVPGYIDPHCHAGVSQEGSGLGGGDINELTDPITPQLRTLDALNPQDYAFSKAVKAGVTAANITPGSGNVIGGQSVAIKLIGPFAYSPATDALGQPITGFYAPEPPPTADAMILREPAGIKAAMGENPKRVYGDQKKMPSTRMGSAFLMREAFVRARNYQRKVEKEGTTLEEYSERDLRLEPLVRILRREFPLRVHAHRYDDIRTALRIRDEFGYDMTLEHATEAYKVIDEIVKRNIPCVFGPCITVVSKLELRDRDLRAPGIIQRAGIKVALTCDHGVVPLEYLPLSAMLVTRHGMDGREALKAITINAAEIVGVADRIGSLVAGKDADFSIQTRHPLDIMSKVERTYANAKPVYIRQHPDE